MDRPKEIFLDSWMNSLKKTTRWSGKDYLKYENVAEHSFCVSWVTSILSEYIYPKSCTELKLKAINYSIFHELDETITGDINHNVKYNNFNGSKIRECLKEFFEHKIKNLNSDDIYVNFIKNDILEVSNETKLIVKTADWISMLIYCKREVDLGNSKFIETLGYCVFKLKEHCDICLKDFNSLGRINKEIFKEIKKESWI